MNGLVKKVLKFFNNDELVTELPRIDKNSLERFYSEHKRGMVNEKKYFNGLEEKLMHQNPIINDMIKECLSKDGSIEDKKMALLFYRVLDLSGRLPIVTKEARDEMIKQKGEKPWSIIGDSVYLGLYKPILTQNDSKAYKFVLDLKPGSCDISPYKNACYELYSSLIFQTRENKKLIEKR